MHKLFLAILLGGILGGPAAATPQDPASQSLIQRRDPIHDDIRVEIRRDEVSQDDLRDDEREANRVIESQRQVEDLEPVIEPASR